uniref:Chloride channel protein n=1 Tax=Panagrolaimus sp. JU765 TaxID=591449 RepID=A0AC34RCZ1_9BILA
MDWAIEFLQEEHKILMDLIHQTKMPGTTIARYFLWISYTVILVTGSALFAHYVASQAIGSGIPEMKTILRGVMLKEYLTFRTLISKIVGLTFSLGSGLPIGKEGPFVHVASVVANLLSHLVHSIDGAYANESRSSEMLAAGCAVGVACTFSAPVGGVLFSIEVTSVYFAVRNYWRGFFAATCSATIFRLLRVFTSSAVTVTAFFQTTFVKEAFLPSELPIFALIGCACGLLSAAFIYIQRNMVLFLRRNRFAKSVFQKYWIIYPIVIALLVSSLTFPDGFGRFIGGEVRFMQAAKNFFQNCTFTETNPQSVVYCNNEIRKHWTSDGTLSPFITLSSFLFVFYFLAAIASTVPIPSGIFGPSFVIGGCIGRLTGELVAYLWEREDNPIYPGVYAVVGAAAFCGGVTHTVSVAVIVFELTGQLVYILPVMIAVLIANAICSYLQPSIYDSIIQIKHLPYLPDIPHSSSNFHGIRVEQFMTSKVQFLSKNSTYLELQNLLLNLPKLKSFPIVADKESKILIGSCNRSKLLHALEIQVGQEARQKEANKRIKESILQTYQRFKPDRIDIERRPSIFDHLSSKNDKKSIKIVDEIDGNNDDDSEVFNFDSEITVELPENEKNGNDRHQSTTSRFTVIPVDKTSLKQENDEGLTNETISTKKLSDQSLNYKKSPSTTTATLTRFKKEHSKSFHGKLNENSTMDETTNSTTNHHHQHHHDVYHTIGGMIRNLTRISLAKWKHKEHDEDYDLTGDERKTWEFLQLSQIIDFDNIGVDQAPFQLVEHSSLFKVHSLFSLLGLNRAYVTNCGQLVGVVALRDLRLAIEKVQSGQLFSNSPPINEEQQNSQSLGFDGAHLVGALPQEDHEDDIANDRLNPRLEVVSRDPSVVSNQMKETNHELIVPQPRHMSISSDPCLHVKIEELPKTQDNLAVRIQPMFQISPTPSPVPSDHQNVQHSPNSSTNSSNSTTPNRKRSRHVQICIPPTPTDPKKDHFNFGPGPGPANV